MGQNRRMADRRPILDRRTPDRGGTGEIRAAIDLGTNSFHLVVARVEPDGQFDVLDREKEVVRLGSGAGVMRRLTPEAIERGIDAARTPPPHRRRLRRHDRRRRHERAA